MGELFLKYQERKQHEKQTLPTVAEIEKPTNGVMEAEKVVLVSKDPKPTAPQPRGIKRTRYKDRKLLVSLDF